MIKPLYAAPSLALWRARGGAGGGPAPGMAAMGRGARGRGWGWGWPRSQPCALALAAALAVCAFYYLGGGGETFSSATRRLRATPPAPAHRHPQRGEAAAGRDLHLLMMFTKAERSPALRAKGQAALRSLLRHGRLGAGDALHLHLVTEGASRDIGLGLLRDLLRGAAFRHQVGRAPGTSPPRPCPRRAGLRGAPGPAGGRAAAGAAAGALAFSPRGGAVRGGRGIPSGADLPVRRRERRAGSFRTDGPCSSPPPGPAASRGRWRGRRLSGGLCGQRRAPGLPPLPAGRRPGAAGWLRGPATPLATPFCWRGAVALSSAASLLETLL